MDISFVRGDTKILAIDALDENGTAYTPVAGDTLTMTARVSHHGGTIAFQKTTGDGDVVGITGGWQVTIQPEDTADLDYVPYVYDIEVELADGYVQTIVPCSNLTLTKEVTYVSTAT